MANPLSIFGGVVPQSDAAKEQIAIRAKQSEQLRALALSPWGAGVAYGIEPGYGQSADDIFVNPAEMEYGRDFYDFTVPKMRTNNLHYASAQERVKDVGEHLELSILAGIPGDRESEIARACVEAAIEANDEFPLSMRIMAELHEIGFRGGELVYGMLTRGEAKNLIYPEAIIPHPWTWFSFDYNGVIRFTPNGHGSDRRKFERNPEKVPDLKVMFGRGGSLHTRYGHGTAQDCYPTVYEIDQLWKLLRKLAERFGYPPMVVTTPYVEGSAGWVALKRQVASHWPNHIVVQGETLSGRTEFRIEGTEGAYAGANATGNMMLQQIAKKEHHIDSFLQGSVPTSPEGVGSFAKENSIDSQKMYRAPSYAACKEAMLNRGFIRWIMLLNFPTLPVEKWPRASVDSSFGEDLRLFMEMVEKLVKMKMPIAWATASERTGIPIAAEGEPLLEAAAPPAIGAPSEDPEADAAKAFSEQLIGIRLRDGRFRQVPPDTKIMTDRGVIRAGNIKGGEVMIADPYQYPRLVI